MEFGALRRQGINYDPHIGRVCDIKAVGERYKRIFEDSNLDMHRFIDWCILKRWILECGTMSDPFQMSEQGLGITRALLQTFKAYRQPLFIATKGNLLIEDERYYDALVDLKDNGLVVDLALIALDDKKLRKFEPRAPLASERIKLVERLVDDGVNVIISCRPILRGVTDEDWEGYVEFLCKLGINSIHLRTLILSGIVLKRKFWKKYAKKNDMVFKNFQYRYKAKYFVDLVKRGLPISEEYGVPLVGSPSLFFEIEGKCGKMAYDRCDKQVKNSYFPYTLIPFLKKMRKNIDEPQILYYDDYVKPLLKVKDDFLDANVVISKDEATLVWSSSCIPPGTMVISNYPNEIQNISVGDKVLTDKGVFRSVTKTFKRHYSGDLINIIPRHSNMPLSFTPEHPILCTKFVGSRMWKQAEKIKEKDYLCFPRITKTVDRQSFFISSVIPMSNFVLTEDNYVCGVDGVRMKDGIKKRNPTSHNIPNEIKTDEAFMRLVGYYLAEGWVTDGGIHFIFNKKETKYISEVAALMEYVFGIHRCSNIKTKANVTKIDFSSVVLGKLFKIMFGKYSSEKHIPLWFLYLPTHKQAELLYGFWCGDGSMTKHGFSLGSSSPRLMYMFLLMFHRLGIIPLFRKYRQSLSKIKTREGGKRVIQGGDFYRMMISGKFGTNLARLWKINHPYLSREKTKTWNIGIVSREYLYIPIRKITRELYDGYVYNLEVDVNHSYCLTNLTAHNCMKKFRVQRYFNMRDIISRSLWRGWGECREGYLSIVKRIRLVSDNGGQYLDDDGNPVYAYLPPKTIKTKRTSTHMTSEYIDIKDLERLI